MATAQPIAAPQHLPAVHRYFEISLFLMICTSVFTLASTGKLDPLSTFVPVVLLAVKALRYRRGHGPELSHRAATTLVILYLLFFPIDLWVFSRAMAQGAPNPILYAALLSTIHLMLFAMIVRLFSARALRDHMFLAMTAFAVMLVAAILTVDMLYLACFLVFLVLSVSTFVALEVRRAAEGAVTPPLAAGTTTARKLDRALNVTSVVVAFSSLLLGTLIFFTFPRVTAGYMSGLNLQPSLISGFSDEVELGQIGRIKRDEAVVMRVRVEGGPEQVAGAYWRGIALTAFDGRRWSSEEREPLVITPNNEGWYYLLTGPVPRRPLERSRNIHYTVVLEPIASNTIFVLDRAAALQGRFSPDLERRGRASPRAYLLVDKTGSVSNPHHSYSKILYRGVSVRSRYSPAELRTASTTYSPEMLDAYLQLPEIDPRIPRLTQQVMGNATTVYDKAAALEQYFRSQFGYTLDLSSTPAVADPLAYFLFDRREGHCEYFASAMTVMLRTQGIPARLVNGFLTGEYNDVGEDFIVRGADAHSWVEVYFPEFGWMTFDPTPPATERTRGMFGRLGLYWDWMQLVWTEWIINYDLRSQRTLFTNLLEGSREWSLRARNYFRSKRRDAVDILKEWQARILDSPSAIPALIGGALLLLVLLRRRALLDYLAAYWGIQIGRGRGPALRRATLYYQQMLKLLERRGLRKAPGQTPLEFAASVGASARAAELAAPVGQVTSLYQAARFGQSAASADEMPAALARLRDALRPH